MLENHLDGAHPAWVHASSVAVARSAPEPGKPGEEHYYDIAVRQMRQNGAPGCGMGSDRHVDHAARPRLHGRLPRRQPPGRRPGQPGVRGIPEKTHRSSVGEKEADRILRVTLWNTIIYPNCSFMSQFRQLRIIHPDRGRPHVVYTYSFRMKNAPAQMFRDTVAFANVVNGTGSWVLTDDLEVYERLQRGLSSGAVDWVYIGRGHGRDVEEPNGVRARRAPARARSSCARSSPPGCATCRCNERRAVSVSRGTAARHAAARGVARALHRRRDVLASPGAEIRRIRSRPARSSTTTARCSSCA